ncbi:hypothetical protein [Weissella halotolerans]|uniref:Uncharacterized protein n=1 Tax=Weissella halotolerans DSM 20190 TaxID=1123500 RepID=A0A0R2FRU9_9LACO|nr:hypothetical protein [Weissella halotolerans]KRN31186.1 hypothetical protein IV68_GL001064 [Weissella halotolerans DSM 20190]
MVKQGSYAKRVKKRAIRQIKQRKPRQVRQNAIKNGQEFRDYLLVRYHLTQGTKVSELVEETIRRFLQVFIEHSMPYDNVWSLPELIQETIKGLANQVPWQYYAILLDAWPQLRGFLLRETKQAPLVHPIQVTNDQVDMIDLVITQLAVNWYLSQVKNQVYTMASVNDKMVAELKETFTAVASVNWQNVKTVYSTTPFVPKRTDYDVGTERWLNELSTLEW